MCDDIIIKSCKYIYPAYGEKYDNVWCNKLLPFFINGKVNPSFGSKREDVIFVEPSHFQYFYHDFKDVKTSFNVLSYEDYTLEKPNYLLTWTTIKTPLDRKHNNYTFISNNCQSASLYSLLNRKYDNPFIASYFQDDFQYLKFCKYYNRYINTEPRFGEAKLPFNKNYKNEGLTYEHILNMFLDDIEITWIHEPNGANILLDKYIRRRQRGLNKTPFFIWGDSLLHQRHTEENRKKLIEEFKKIPNSIYIHKESRPEYIDKSFDDRVEDDGCHARPVNWIHPEIINEEVIKRLNDMK